MAIDVIERFDSRESTTGSNASVNLRYIVKGTDSDIDAKAALAAEAPAFYDGLARQSRHIVPIGDPTHTLLWEGTVRYGGGGSTAPSTGESTFSFDTGGGSQHITQSIQTRNRIGKPGNFPPNFQGAIGVTQDAVEGVDITIPVYNFGETHYIDDALVTQAYRQSLFETTGRVNSAAFRGFAAGDVLFLGASGAKRGQGDWEISFRFAVSKTRANFTVGGITVPEKKGWDYMWVRYSDVQDNAARMVVKQPLAVYIEQVYEEASFGALGIGS